MEAKNIPYGLTDFARIQRDNYYYVDKTQYIPLIERAAPYFFLIRPRRFGKSLLINVLSWYYDINLKDRLMPDLLHQPEITYSYIVEVKYARRDATDADIEALRREATGQLQRYPADPLVAQTKGDTRLGLITLVFKGWELVVCEM